MKELTLKKIVSFINEIISFMLSCTQKENPLFYFIILYREYIKAAIFSRGEKYRIRRKV